MCWGRQGTSIPQPPKMQEGLVMPFLQDTAPTWVQEISKAKVAKQLGTNAICHAIHDFRAIVCRIDVETERAFAERHSHNSYDCIRHCRDICINRCGARKSVHDLSCEVCVGTGLIRRERGFVMRRTGMSEVVRS